MEKGAEGATDPPRLEERAWGGERAWEGERAWGEGGCGGEEDRRPCEVDQIKAWRSTNFRVVKVNSPLCKPLCR